MHRNHWYIHIWTSHCIFVKSLAQYQTSLSIASELLILTAFTTCCIDHLAANYHGFTYDNITTLPVESDNEALSNKSGGPVLTTRVFLAVLETRSSAKNQEIIANRYSDRSVTLFLQFISTDDPEGNSSNKRSLED
jgi:hypothetical protein